VNDGVEHLMVEFILVKDVVGNIEEWKMKIYLEGKSDMMKLTSNMKIFGTRITKDGKEFEGVRSVSFNHNAGELPQLELNLLSECEIELNDCDIDKITIGYHTISYADFIEHVIPLLKKLEENV
jgi:hypothetical protein